MQATCSGSHYYWGSNSLVRATLNREIIDEQVENMDKNSWYKCDVNKLSPSLSCKFTMMSRDDETEQFMEQCREKADCLFTQILHSILKSILSWFMTHTAINSLLQRGSMFVFSKQQFLRLLGKPSSWKGENLLDIGAGDGNVTNKMASFFHHTFVTEAAPGMRKLLAKKGFTVLDVASWSEDNTTYDVISILNVLDRCDQPVTMLDQAKRHLKPEDGRLVIALALPFSTYVELGRKDHKPTEVVCIQGDTFEDQVESAVKFFQENGLQVQCWTRLPYLCEGDLHQSFYWLFDAVFILKVQPQNGGECQRQSQDENC